MVARLTRPVLICLIPALLLGSAGYVGLIKLGLVRNPFGPSIAGDVAQARSGRPALRILFVGNSLTYENDMPEMVDRLAAADPGPLPVFVVSDTLGGRRLSYWADNGGLRNLLSTVHWNVVVLQEQSEIPSFARADRARLMDGPLRSIDRQVRNRGARTELFMTWAHEGGEFSGDSYQAMQDRLAIGYLEEAKAIGADVVPVGLAWSAAHARAPSLQLWADDGTHPSVQGSYLAACVMYASLTGRTPEGNRYLAGIDPATAHFLQRIAAGTR
jgi:hypothetical protein